MDDLVRDLFIALAGDDVDGGLAADELGQGRHHNRIAEFGPDPRRFLQSLFQVISFSDAPKLVAQVGDHPAGDLVMILGLIVLHGGSDGKTFALGDEGEMFGDGLEDLFIDQRLVSQSPGIAGDIKQRGVR